MRVNFSESEGKFMILRNLEDQCVILMIQGRNMQFLIKEESVCIPLISKGANLKFEQFGVDLRFLRT